MARTTLWRSVVSFTLLSLLISCGGGGGGGGGPRVVGPTNPPVTPPPASTPPLGNAIPGPRPTVGPQSFVNFESGPVRPIVLSADGARLFVANIPDNRLEIFDVASALTQVGSVPVGLDPVAIAEDPQGRVWVVNHLSDSISIVDVQSPIPHVVQTLWVGDEPRDIVFAGPDRDRAFITTAHRGQNSPVDPALSTPSIGRADIWVFDSTAVDETPGGQSLDIITLFGEAPRPLAVSVDGTRVYAGIFRSGNRTTTIGPSNISKGAPTTDADGVAQPDSGVIVRFDGQNWVDDSNQVLNGGVPFTLPDFDVFEIDATNLSETDRFVGVGTTLFNMAVNPVDDTIYVSNTDARNHVRFSGVASRASTTVRGHVVDQRITIIQNGLVQPRFLNKHIDFDNETDWASDRDVAISTPLDMAVTSDGSEIYVTAFGSAKVAVYTTSALEDHSFLPGAPSLIELTGGGPSGIALDEANDRAYVYTRFDNGISTINLDTRQEIDHDLLFNPEPVAVQVGRPFLYDAVATSGNGNDSCASCHIFGDNDALAWDVGEPDGSVSPITNVFIPISPAATPAVFHSMKGPMTTQSMRGLKGHGPMHWRGDRSGANRVGGETLEEAAFKEFNDAFDAFGGLGGELSTEDMQVFTDFSMGISYPPNPIRALDNQLQGPEIRGEELFNNGVVRVQTGILEVCVQCHTLDPARGLFGTKGLSSDNSQPGEQNFKIPHFRDQYQKIGMFGFGFQTTAERGPQVRGFGFNHNGATSTNFGLADLGMPENDLIAIRAFLNAFPTEMAPIVGQAVTFSDASYDAAQPRIDLLIERATVTDPVPECDLVASGNVNGELRSWEFDNVDRFNPATTTQPPLSLSELRTLLVSAGDRLTMMCVPWGSGRRIAIDRDLDGILNEDE